MRPLNTDAFLYVKLTAQQVDDERTTAVVRFTIVYSPTTDTISSNNLSYIFQQLILYLPTTYSGSSSTPSHIYQHPNPLSRTDGGTSI